MPTSDEHGFDVLAIEHHVAVHDNSGCRADPKPRIRSLAKLNTSSIFKPTATSRRVRNRPMSCRRAPDHAAFGCADQAGPEQRQTRLDALGVAHGGIAGAPHGSGLSFRDPDNIARSSSRRLGSPQARERLVCIRAAARVPDRVLARELLRAAKDANPSALTRIRAVSERVSLSAAQLAVAREYGFASWPALHAEVERWSPVAPPPYWSA